MRVATSLSQTYRFPEVSIVMAHGVPPKPVFPLGVERTPEGSISRAMPQIEEPKYTLPARSAETPLGPQTGTLVAWLPLPLLPEIPAVPFPAIVVMPPDVSTLR